MKIEQFLQLISPNITLYSVLLTFAIISFKTFKLFWKYEKDLRDENFNRMKDLLGSFRRKYIEPIINQKLIESIEVAYENAFGPLINDLYSEPRLLNGEVVQELVNEEELKEIIDRDALIKRKENLQKFASKDLDAFFSAASGGELFNKLDQLYEQKSILSKQYRTAFVRCRISSYSFLVLSVILFLGILQILGKWPEWMLFLWIFLSAQLLITGSISSICLEICRRDLANRWEELQFYDKI